MESVELKQFYREYWLLRARSFIQHSSFDNNLSHLIDDALMRAESYAIEIEQMQNPTPEPTKEKDGK